MRLILQLCLLVLMLLGAEKRAWGKVATSPQAAVRDWVQDSRLGGGIDAPPRQPTSREAAAWDDDIASAGDIHREDTLTMAGPVVVTSRGTAFLMCPGAPPPFIGSYRTTTPAWVAYGPNLYAYVMQNPWTSFDPDGLKTKQDYRDDMRTAGRERAAEMKALGPKASDRAKFGVENRYKNRMWAAQQGINGIEQTARKMEYYNRSTGLQFTAHDEEMMDDNDSLYKNFNRTVGLVTMVPGSGTADHAMHGEYGQAALSFGLDVGLMFVGGRLVKVPAANNVAGSALRVNPTGGGMNCVNCAIATDAKLAGNLASAMPGGATPISVLEKTFGGSFQSVAGQMEISTIVSQAGNGARGIVYGASKTGNVGHVWNVVNQNGTIRFLDGQTGATAAKALSNFDNFANFRFLHTNP